MADALCGPSNALQNFKRHAQVDRSLQQDRLAGPRTPVQGFRSQDPRAGSLDADFHAFENAAASPFQEPFVGDNFAAQSHIRQPAPNWAADFQQLRISDSPLSTQHFRAHAPLVTSTNPGWQNEFMRQQSGQAPMTKGKQVAFDQQNVSSYAPQQYYSGLAGPMSSAYNFQQPMDMQQDSGNLQSQEAGQLNDADWSQAFEEAFQDAFQDADQIEQAKATEEPQTLNVDDTHTHDHSAEVQQTEQARIGSDAIQYTEVKDRMLDQETKDASALARVAGELLHNVQHDSSEKFQNSQFLDLMRKIRDRQVEVRNNDFETTEAELNQNLAQPSQNLAGSSEQEIRNVPDPIQNQDTFAFPNMDPVYSPREADFVDYSFDSDQFPSPFRNQMSELHPGVPAATTTGGGSQPISATGA